MVRALTLGVWTRADAVPGAGHRGDDRGFAEPFAQGRDSYPDRVGERVGVLIPCPSQELLSADHTPLGGDEYLQHGELLTGERDVATVSIDLAAERIQTQARDLSHRRAMLAASAVKCSQA